MAVHWGRQDAEIVCLLIHAQLQDKQENHMNIMNHTESNSFPVGEQIRKE